MKDLRERCEKLYQDIFGMGTQRQNRKDLIEAFAREIRNEALEAAMAICQKYADRNRVGEDHPDGAMAWCSTYHRIAGENCREEIRALKDPASEGR